MINRRFMIVAPVLPNTAAMLNSLKDKQRNFVPAAFEFDL
jgi:hypothetical protein